MIKCFDRVLFCRVFVIYLVVWQLFKVQSGFKFGIFILLDVKIILGIYLRLEYLGLGGFIYVVFEKERVSIFLFGGE